MSGESISVNPVTEDNNKSKILFTPDDDFPLIAFSLYFFDHLEFPARRVNQILRIKCEYPDSPDVTHNIWSDESLFWKNKDISDKELTRVQLVSVSEEVVEDSTELQEKYGWCPNPKDKEAKAPYLTLIHVSYRKTEWKEEDDEPKIVPDSPIETYTWLHSFTSHAEVPRPPVSVYIV